MLIPSVKTANPNVSNASSMYSASQTDPEVLPVLEGSGGATKVQKLTEIGKSRVLCSAFSLLSGLSLQGLSVCIRVLWYFQVLLEQAVDVWESSLARR